VKTSRQPATDVPHRKLCQALIKWYRAYHRALPWREINDPYATWVSEIMLQQTQVQTVIPYFEQWMQRFPTVGDLAAAPLDDVLKRWEGLGYYSRARNLHEAARRVVDGHGGRVPQAMKELVQLPGIGRYTAGAIASIAFHQPEPILDGNVARVLCRVFGVEGDPKKNPSNAQLWNLAADLVIAASRRKIRDAASDLNQALMELGATVCAPNNPNCPRCPILRDCEANRSGRQSVLPQVGKRPATVRPQHVAAVIRRNGRYLIAQRPVHGTWGGLWEFPRGGCGSNETPESAVVRIAKEMVALDVSVVEKVGEVNHSCTHHAITLYAFLCRARGRTLSPFYARWQWVKPGEVSDFASPAPQIKILELVAGTPLSQ